MDTLSLSIIARIHTPFAEKFGVPRQSGLAPTAGRIVFAPEYRNPDALRGLEGFSHLWLVWVSCVELTGVAWDTPDGPVIHVRGADLVDGTPILDIKPYLPYCDARPDARGGFTDALNSEALAVACPPALLEKLPEADRPGLLAVLANDPRPRYQDDPQRVYGLTYAGCNVTFRVEGETVVIVGVE